MSFIMPPPDTADPPPAGLHHGSGAGHVTAHALYNPSLDTTHNAVHVFVATELDDLELEVGDELTLILDNEDGWHTGQVSSRWRDRLSGVRRHDPPNQPQPTPTNHIPGVPGDLTAIGMGMCGSELHRRRA